MAPALSRGVSEFTAMGMDLNSRAFPHLLCEDKNAFVVALCSKPASGWVCGVSWPVIACSVTIKDGFRSQQQTQSIQQSGYSAVCSGFKPVTSAPLVPVDPRLSTHCRSCYWCVST